MHHARQARVARLLERVTGESVGETSQQGLQRLVDQQVPESSHLDFKVDAYDGSSTRGRTSKEDEFRKDITALANAAGGVLLLGVAEVDGVASRLVGVAGPLESHEGRLRSWLRSRIVPHLDGVAIHGVAGGSVGWLVVLVPPSPRRPHAVVPMQDHDALKYARRVGRHTEWLSEGQVADLYRARFSGGLDVTNRLDELEREAQSALPRRRWLLLTTVPEEPGVFVVDRTAQRELETWWLQGEAVQLNPHVARVGISDVRIGPRQVVLEGRDATSVPIGCRLAFHHDGATQFALEMDGPPSGNPALYLDHAVGAVVEHLGTAARFAIERGGTGGLAQVRLRFFAPGRSDLPIYCLDPSWSPARLQPSPVSVVTEHTVDLDAVASSYASQFEAAGIVAAGFAQFFGEADALYLSASGVVRAQQFDAPTRDRHVLPLCSRLEVPVDQTLSMG